MFRVRSPSLASVRKGSNYARTRCLGLINNRTATFLLAFIGIFAHFQTYKHLEVLYDSFPTVPKSRNGGGYIPVRSEMMFVNGHKYDRGNRFNQIRPSEPATVVLDSEFNFDQQDFVGILNDEDQQIPTAEKTSNSQPVSVIWTPSSTSTAAIPKATVSAEDLLAMVKPTRWFNLLPKRPWGEGRSSPEQDEERKSWEAARMLTMTMRIYSILSVIACLIGTFGVVRSHLFSTRIFLLSSLFDVFLFALSIMSLCIIITYPEIRSMLCEQISSGELHSFLRGSNSNSSSNYSNHHQDPSMAALPQPPASVLPAANFITKSASSFWARTLDGGKNNDENSSIRSYWWDTLIDDMLENESCDDIFVSVLVPIGLVVCLTYLALRIHFLLVIRSYYTSLIRQRMGFYLESSSSDTSKSSSKENLSTINEKFDKI